jgi:NUMOD3 motif-containing protein
MRTLTSERAKLLRARVSRESAQKNRARSAGFKGHKHTAETKAKISANRTGKGLGVARKPKPDEYMSCCGLHRSRHGDGPCTAVAR